MPNHVKYEVDDTAKSFPKTQESMSKSGKKLQSLFKEFYEKESKPFVKNKTLQEEAKFEKDDTEVKRPAKAKKRKFSLEENLKDLQSNINDIIRKLDVKLDEPKNKKMKNNLDGFSKKQKKKVKSNLSNCQFQVQSEKPGEDIESKNKKMKRNSEKFFKKQKKILKSNLSDCQSEKPGEDNEPKYKEISEKLPKKHKKKLKSNLPNYQIQVESEKSEDIKPNNKKIEKSSKKFSKKQKKKLKSSLSNCQIQAELYKPEEDVKPENKETKRNSLPQIDFPRRIKKKKKSYVHSSQTNSAENSNVFQGAVSVQSVPAKQKFKSDSISKFDPQVKGLIKKAKHKIYNESEDTAVELRNKPEADQFELDEDADDDSIDKTEVKRPKKIKWKKRNASLNTENQMSFESEPDKLKLLNVNKERDYDDELTRTLFVANLPTNLQKKDLKILFSEYGSVERIRYTPVETDRNKIFKFGGPKPKVLHKAATSLHGFVMFEDRKSATDALALNGTVYKDRHITVNFALPTGQKKIYDNNKAVFIGNLPFDVDDENVWNAFAECGKIAGVRVVRDLETGIGKGFGYILFDTVETRQKALEMEKVEIKGRLIRVKKIDKNSSKGNRPLEKNANHNEKFKKDSFKSRAINLKKSYQETHVNSRKSLGKIMKKSKGIHQKKKIASLLGKAMKL